MRSKLFVLGLLCVFGLPLMVGGPVSAQTEGGVAFTIHAATCPLDYEGGIYEACHHNYLEGATFTLTADGIDPAAIVTGVDGVGSALVLAGLESAGNAVLAENPVGQSLAGGWVYCKDQISGFVLYDGPLPETGAIPLGTILSTQATICDWYRYGDVQDVQTVAANG